MAVYVLVSGIAPSSPPAPCVVGEGGPFQSFVWVHASPQAVVFWVSSLKYGSFPHQQSCRRHERVEQATPSLHAQQDRQPPSSLCCRCCVSWGGTLSTSVLLGIVIRIENPNKVSDWWNWRIKLQDTKQGREPREDDFCQWSECTHSRVCFYQALVFPGLFLSSYDYFNSVMS